MQRERVIVVGAGIGGLVAALVLASAGREVLVLERAAAPGGKMRQVAVGDQRLDAGPTVFTMRWVFEELFALAGTTLESKLGLRPIDVLARHAWPDGSRLDLFADVERSAAAMAQLAGAAEGDRYRAFCRRAQGIYDTLERPFLRGSRPNPVSLALRVMAQHPAGLLRISPFARMAGTLARSFGDARLVQLFARYATYCGSSPWLAPATLMLVAHVERCGVWSVDGGMHQLARTVAELARARGAVLRYGAHVARIEVQGGHARGVQLSDGERLEASAVLFNGDVAALANGLLGDAVKPAVPRVPPAQRSLSAVTWNVVAPTRGFDLCRHNVFFGPPAAYAQEFADIFGAARPPAQPTVYVCAQDREGGREPAVGAAERLLCLVNAPAIGDQPGPGPEEIERCETTMFEQLRRCGLQLQPVTAPTVRTTPVDFERLFPATGGALYGRSSHGWQASFSRPGARSALPGLYLAGGSTHPGPGVPMAALSGWQAATSLLADHRARTSTSKSRTAAMPGGISTR